jgi:hypothetical protein
MAVVVIILVLVLAVVGAYFAHLEHQKRLTALQALADRLGWQFSADYDYDHEDQFSQFEIFQRGHSRYAYNTLTGTLEVGGGRWPVKLGDFHYKVTSNSGKHRTTRTYLFSYIILRLPYRALPELLVRQEGMFDAVKNLFGFDDIDFESAEFSRRFCVKSPDRRFAYDVLHPRMIEFLLEYEPPTIDIESGCCALADGSDQWSVEQFQATLDWARHFFELWPEHVKSQREQKA